MTDFNSMLSEMRLSVEPLLQECAGVWPGLVPSCLSQSLRAQRAIALIQRHIQDLRGGSDPKDLIGTWLKKSEMLSDFLAVHRASDLLYRFENEQPAPT